MKKRIEDKDKTPVKQSGKKMNIEEPTMEYRSVRKMPQLKEFTFLEFKKISDKAPLSNAEWADILHISERTLQRYAKSNGSFAPINAERALQIDRVLKEGKLTFGSTEKFYEWLKKNPTFENETLSLHSLKSFDGIQQVLTQLGRIQHGLFA